MIVRELLMGPRRFSDLLEGLPGIGTNLLSDRLRALQDEGLIERRKLPPPAGSTVYELTALGRELESALWPLVGWGVRFLDEPGEAEHFRIEWYLLAMRANANADLVGELSGSCEFRVGEHVFSVRVEDGELEMTLGPAPSPDAIVTTDIQTFLDLGAGQLTPRQAVRRGRATVEGDAEAAMRWSELLASAAPAAKPEALAGVSAT